ncbi:MAG: hypothetical protein CVV27_03200 [Candidatus Melainabacteria bacterium HGW-Melainabacteria-1]|nr:MAG: hypothetical protein CVV27_03200 [Candidatus Melainabacteria bacterium HGW-Melainabacteria-1]
MSIPTQALYVNQGDPSQRGLMTDAEIASRRQLLARTPLLRSLSEDERGQLAEKLISAPFLTGEVITRQGAEGHWLYLLAEGEVSIRLRNEAGHEAEVNRIQAVGFFGEMSLMTGEPRGSTVVALSDVLCYRLDKESFQEIIQRRPEIAEVIAQTLAERRAQTELASHLMAVDEHARHVAAHKHSILSSIQAFFRLEQPRL